MIKRIICQFFLLNTLVFILFITPIHPVSANKMPNGSQIANVSIENMSDEEAYKMLETETVIWQAQEDINLKSDFEQITIPRSVFEFHIEETIDEFNEQTKRTLTSLFMRQKNVHKPLKVTINESDQAIIDLKNRDYINYDDVITKLEEVASLLKETDVVLTYVDENHIPFDAIAKAELEIPKMSEAVLTYAIQQLDGYVFGTKEHFSLLETVTFPEHLTKSNEEISFLGTALYTLFLQVNFDIIERHSHNILPEYAQPGLDASINMFENEDLIIINADDISYKLKLEKKGDKLIGELQSSTQNVTYEYEIEEIAEVDQRTIYRYSNSLIPGEERVIEEGQKGLRVEVNRSIYNENVFMDTELISQDVYLPEPAIKLVSSSEREEEPSEVDEVTTSTQPSDLNVRPDDNLFGDHNQLPPDFYGIDPNIPSLHEQILELKDEQKTLGERLNLVIESMDLFFEDDYKQFKKEISKKLKKMDEEIERILKHILNEKGDDVDGKEAAR